MDSGDLQEQLEASITLEPVETADLRSIKLRGLHRRKVRRARRAGGTLLALSAVLLVFATGAVSRSGSPRIKIEQPSDLPDSTVAPSATTATTTGSVAVTTCPAPPQTTSDPNLHPYGTAARDFISSMQAVVPHGYTLHASDRAGSRFAEVIDQNAQRSVIRASINILSTGWNFTCDMRLAHETPTWDPDVYLSAQVPISASQIFVGLSQNRELTVTSVDGLTVPPSRASVDELLRIGNALKARLAN